MSEKITEKIKGQNDINFFLGKSSKIQPHGWHRFLNLCRGAARVAPADAVFKGHRPIIVAELDGQFCYDRISHRAPVL